MERTGHALVDQRPNEDVLRPVSRPADEEEANGQSRHEPQRRPCQSEALDDDRSDGSQPEGCPAYEAGQQRRSERHAHCPAREHVAGPEVPQTEVLLHEEHVRRPLRRHEEE